MTTADLTGRHVCPCFGLIINTRITVIRIFALIVSKHTLVANKYILQLSCRLVTERANVHFLSRLMQMSK